MTSFFIMPYWVYILYSESSDTYYKGQTDDLWERLNRHNNGWEKSTKHGVPWSLIWSTVMEERSSALNLERKLKNLTRERLIKFIQKYGGVIAGPDDP